MFVGTVVAAWSTVWEDDAYFLAPNEQVVTATQTVEDRLGLDDLDPRATADDLFNQIVDAASSGDSTHVYAFLPMAIAAYDEASPLDADGLFHVSTLLLIGRMADQSLAGARMILDVDPDHLLGLGAAAEAAVDLGLTDQATTYYEHILEVYDAQVDRELTEYLGHATLLQRIRNDAGAFLGER